MNSDNSRGHRCRADSKFRDLLVLIRRSKTEGVDRDVLCDLLATTPQSLRQMAVRYRELGIELSCIRTGHKTSSYYLPEYVPPPKTKRDPNEVGQGRQTAMRVIIERLEAAGHAGINMTEAFDGLMATAVRWAMPELRRAGKMFSHAPQIRHVEFRLYGREQWVPPVPLSKSALERAVAAQNKAERSRPPKTRLFDVRENAVSPQWRSLSPKPPREVIIPKDVRITILPSAPVYSRHQCLPGAAVPRVVNPAECRAWARSV